MNKQHWSERFDEEFLSDEFVDRVCWITKEGKNDKDAMNEIKSFIQTVEKEAEERGVKVGWVRAAVCPECDGSGAYYADYGEVVQCQWCDERKKLIEALEAPK